MGACTNNEIEGGTARLQSRHRAETGAQPEEIAVTPRRAAELVSIKVVADEATFLLSSVDVHGRPAELKQTILNQVSKLPPSWIIKDLKINDVVLHIGASPFQHRLRLHPLCLQERPPL